MQNLTSNAIKALKNTPESLIRREISQENSHLILSISDNGPGVAMGQLDALYSDQASIGVKSSLGPHLVRDLAKAIPCTISVFSGTGNGTVFQLRLGDATI